MRPSEALARHRDEVVEAITRLGASNPRVFGSVARGEDDEDSDLDILVDLDPPSTYYVVFKIEDALAELLGVRVEVYTPGNPTSRFMQRISPDVRPI